jgi:hypothetical protein
MKFALQSALLFWMLALSASSAYPCSCADPSQREKFRRASAVFIGRVIEITDYNDPDEDFVLFTNRVKFKVERQWKGARKPEVTALASFDSPGMCGDLNLAVGEEYLVYADREKGRLLFYTDCGPNRNSKYAEDEIKRLNSFWFRFVARLYPYPKL